MINHCRTLLMNKPGGKQALDELGEEAIPSTFRGQELPSWLKSYWEAIFGSQPEPTYLNFQVDRLLKIIHASPYSDYLLRFDKRLTYDPNETSVFATFNYGISFGKTIASSNLIDIAPVGSFNADLSKGLMTWLWTIQLTNGVITVTETRTQNSSTANIFSGTNVSELVDMPEKKDFKLRLQMLDNNPANWNATAFLKLTVKPEIDLIDVITKLENINTYASQLFGTSRSEPFVTFENLWKSDIAINRLIGIILAIVYRMHELYFQEKI